MLSATYSCVEDEVMTKEGPVVEGSVLKLNEIMSKDVGDNPDWIEVYNSGTQDIDISGYFLNDKAVAGGYEIPTGTIITAGGFYLVDANESGESISSGGEDVSLAEPDGTIVDHTITPDMSSDVGLTWAREIDGAGEWMVSSPTPGSSNGSAANTAPIIDAEPLTEFTEVYGVNVSDLSGIASVKLILMVSDGVQSIDMALVEGEYKTSVPMFNVGDVVKYYVIATDTSGLTAVYPEGGTETPAEFTVEGPAIFTAEIKLNEVLSDGSPDWLELYNASNEDANLEGYAISDSGAKWIIPNIVIPAKGHLVFDCDGLDTNGSTNFKISKGGETLTLFDPNDEVIDEVTTVDMSAQAGLTYGREDDGSNVWVIMSPSPNAPNSNLIIGEIKLNEIMSDGDPDWIELYNSGEESIDLAGYKLKDSGAEWVIPSITIPAKGFVSFDCDGNDTNGSTNFKIGKSGETITLLSPSDEILDEITTANMSEQTGLTYGREVESGDAWVVMNPTKGALNSTNIGTSLVLVNSFDIDVLEPSGLGISSAGDHLYTVSDNSNKIYKLSLIGEVVETYAYEGNDLEGVTAFTDEKLLVAEEALKQLIEYDITTGTSTVHDIAYTNNADNGGIEGVAYNATTDKIYILNEKDPGLLLEIANDYSVSSELALDLAADYSGIFCDESDDTLWIVSDQSKTLNHCTVGGALIARYPLDFGKAEGVVVTSDKVYMVSDSEAKLYIYERP